MRRGEPGYVMDGPVEDLGASGSSFRIRKFFTFLLKCWWVPVLTLVVCLAAAAVFIRSLPPAFVSKARMWETVKLRLPEGSLFSEDVQNVVGTQSELLQSTTLRDLALARLRAASNGVRLPLGKDGQPLSVAVRVAQSAKSSVFSLEAIASDPAYTQAYLDALMQVYLEYKRNVRKVVSGDTLASITEQVQRAERDLKNEQEVLTAFERTNNLAILQEEGTISGGYLARLKTQLSDLQLEDRLMRASASEQQTEPGATSTNNLWLGIVAGVSAGSQSPVSSERQTAFKELEVLKMRREKLSKNLRPKHPKIVKLDADIERGEKLLEIYRRQNREELAASRQALQLKIDNVQGSIKEWEAKVVEANSRIAEAERLRRTVQRAQQVYERLALLVQNVGISRNIDQETLSVLEPASPPKRSYAQELSLASVGGLGGLGLGLGIIVLIMLRDDRLTSLTEISEKLGQVIVGQVPEMQRLEGAKSLALLENDDRRHAYAESYRSLRSALFFMDVEGQRPKTLLITSAVPDEGKSTIAANLARTLALGGSRVLLVDADMRKGHLHNLLGLQSEPGLAEVLRHPATLEKAIQTNSLPNFAFLPRGSLLSHSGDLLLSRDFDRIIERLGQQFDYVLIDSSPVFASDDTTTLAPKVDGTLFVVRRRFSRAGPAREALELLYQRQAKVLGVVFNQADASTRSYYYYKYAEYQLPAKTG